MTGIHDAMRRQDSLIDQVGWAVMHILPTDDDPDTVPFFSYTVGLTARFTDLLLGDRVIRAGGRRSRAVSLYRSRGCLLCLRDAGREAGVRTGMVIADLRVQ